jgi:hypothetical protein
MALSQSEIASDVQPDKRPRITGRSVVFGLITAGVMAYVQTLLEEVLHAGSLVKSSFPVALILGFLVWVVINMVIARLSPRHVFSRHEMMVMFTALWIVGMMPSVGWMGYFVGALPAPYFFATPENRWADLFLDELPLWAFPEPSAWIMDRFYFGMQTGETVPWAEWIFPVLWWFSGALALMSAGFFVIAIFHRQWVDAERLTYPLVNFPMELMDGFDEGLALPKIFRDPVFWAGFAWTAGIIGWNVLNFWFPNVPRITLFDNINTKAMTVARGFPDVYLRVLPLVIGLGYLCSLDLLFSFWFFGLFSVVKVGVMNRTGFAIGLPGQIAASGDIINLESHGAMTVLVIWSVWIARRHLAHVFRTAWHGQREGGPFSYRVAVVGLILCTVYLCGFFMALGMSFKLAVVHLLLMFIAYFATSKFIAATGFGYLFPVWIKGAGFITSVLGTETLSVRELTAMQLVNSPVFYGDTRIQTLQALPHHLKAMDDIAEDRGRAWVPRIVYLSFAIGFFVCEATLIYYCYHDSALYLRSWTLWEGPLGIFGGIGNLLSETEKTSFDPQKLSVWLFGAAEAGLLATLRTIFPWWPLHPLGLAFQFTTGPRYYALSILIVWVAKLVIIKVGGPQLYQRAKPFFYGTVIGYCVGIAVGMVIDLIWFPGSGHGFHNF